MDEETLEIVEKGIGPKIEDSEGELFSLQFQAETLIQPFLLDM
jgi:hypothetical protein